MAVLEQFSPPSVMPEDDAATVPGHTYHTPLMVLSISLSLPVVHNQLFCSAEMRWRIV